RRIVRAARTHSNERDALQLADAALARLTAMGQATPDDYLCCVRDGWYWGMDVQCPATAALVGMGSRGRDAACAIAAQSSPGAAGHDGRSQALWILAQFKGDAKAISAIIQSAIADDGESRESDALIQQGPAALAPLRKALTDPSLTAHSREALELAMRRIESAKHP
ncbi:MAG TPA: hypothetical protein VLJ39_22560, partial [Tepidisphaeraceae bacterium]|nr:hypothetical protein [Tepidisphaeraceae bacterium]